MAEEANKKSKMDLVLAREHQCVLAAATKVFANPLPSYNHKDDLLDIIVALGLDCTGTMTLLTECIQSHLASHPVVASQVHFNAALPPIHQTNRDRPFHPNKMTKDIILNP